MFQHHIPTAKAEDTSSRLSKLFEIQLRSTTSLDHVKDTIKQLGLNLAHDPSYSELAFDHLLNSNYSLASEFLLDPSLNPPAASNYSKIITYLKENVADTEQRKSLLQAIYRGFSLGLIQREEAQVVLRDLPDILMNSKDGPIRAGDTTKINKYYYTIFRRLAECDVFTIRDLGVDIINAWIGYAKQISWDHYAVELILSLTKSLAGSEAMERFQPDSAAFQVFMSEVEISTASDLTKRWLEYVCERPARRELHLRRLTRFLSRISPAVLRSIIIEIPDRLIVSIRNDKLSPEVLLMWEQVLLQFEKETVTPVLEKNPVWTKKSNGTDPRLPADARLVLRLWTALTLCNGAEEHLILVKQMDFPSQLGDQFEELDPNLLWSRILLTLQSLPKLRFKGQLFDLLNEVNQLQSEEGVILPAKQEAVLDTFATQSFAVLQDDKAYLHALHHLNGPLKELAESVNKDITGFARIVLPLIARDKLSFRIVTRVLKHNERFHFALTKAWSSLPSGTKTNAMKISDPSTNVSRLTELAAILNTSCDLNFHEAVMKFMHDLAISFALSPALSDRQALRKVFWCFSFLHRYGAPVHPPITKALWYAGVTRCEGRGTARRVLAWLFRKVGEVEGHVTVEGLIASRDFRTTRAKEVWCWGRRLGEGLARDEETVTASDKALARDEAKTIADERELVEDEDVLPKIRKSTDIDEKELAKEIWLHKRRQIQGSESCPDRVSRLHEPAPKNSLVKGHPMASGVSAKPMARGACKPATKKAPARPVDLSRTLPKRRARNLGATLP